MAAIAAYHKKENGRKKIKLPEIQTIVDVIIVILAATSLLTKKPQLNSPIKCDSIANKLNADPSIPAFAESAYNT